MNMAAVIILALNADFPEEQQKCASRCGSSFASPGPVREAVQAGRAPSGV